ncbi:hypothetical protein ACI77O_13385 [Pseudomonas tritici]|uniref:hypothetical protein n=1 Tax=Pseudomonas tritici TaxID=2745518 RepID=UPI00387ABC85
MFEIQVARLTASHPNAFNTQQACEAVARTYGYEKLNLSTGELSGFISGLQPVKSHKEMLSLDPVHQLMEFMRMALNLSLSSLQDKHDGAEGVIKDVRRGVPERVIVASMMGFSNFDALLNYARSDPVDPNTTNKEMLKKFQVRFGYYAPIQYVLGRYIHEHTLIIQPDDALAQRFVDQEVILNPLNNTKVAIVRDAADGGDRLSLMAPGTVIKRSSLGANYSAASVKALGKGNVFVSILPSKTYSLLELVQSHADLLTTNSPDGRALIVQVQAINLDTADLDAAFTLANAKSIHVVVIVKQPDAELWKRTGIRLIFGFAKDVRETYLEMDTFIGYSATYVGFKRGKMQYLYQSENTGPRFGAMDLIPDDEKTKTLLQRMKEVIRG